jgi:predicted NBD/HSP70 family sugar kinase
MGNRGQKNLKNGIFQKLNARRIVALVRSNGSLSRTQLAQMLGVMPSTVTRLVTDLIQQGFVVETSDPSRLGRKGFPAKLLCLVPDSILTAGVFFDPDRIYSCIADFNGNILSEDRSPIKRRSFDAVMRQASQSIQDQTTTLGIKPEQIAGCGVCYPGQHTGEPGRILKTKQFSDWPNVDTERDLAPFFDFPVFHINDAKAACLAELYYGACKSYQNFCYIWLSYGIGGAAVVNQDLYLGHNFAAAEFGGLFPKSKPRPSGQDLLDTLRASGQEIDRLSDVEDRHLELPASRQWIRSATDDLTWLCLVIARSFAPEAIVFGGTLNSKIIDEIQSQIAGAKQLGEDFLIAPPKILRAITDSKPQLGAAALPINELLNPSKFRGRAHRGGAQVSGR